MPPKRKHSAKRKPKAAALRAFLGAVETGTPLSVGEAIRAGVFPNNPEIVRLVGEARDSLAQARGLYHQYQVRGMGAWPWGQWNHMVDLLNTAKGLLYSAAQLASKKPHAPMLKGNKMKFTKRALDFHVTAGPSWASEYIDRLDATSLLLLDLANIPQEDVAWSRAAKWSDAAGGGQKTRRKRRRRHESRRAKKL